jgi:hypothetical protein
MANVFEDVKELREKFIRAVYDLRHSTTGMATVGQIAERMGLDSQNNMRDAELYGDIAQYFDQMGYIRKVSIGYAVVAITARGKQYVEGDLERQAVMEDRVRRYALQVLRAIRDQHPNVRVGTWVDPYTAAFETGLGYPIGPSYGQAIEYLVEEDAIEWAEETATALGNPLYRIKRRGMEMMEEE